jgi:hypothetical protein
LGEDLGAWTRLPGARNPLQAAVAVVDRLEVVDVENQQGNLVPKALGTSAIRKKRARRRPKLTAGTAYPWPLVRMTANVRANICPIGAIAQLGERLDRTQEVAGSSPASSISWLLACGAAASALFRQSDGLEGLGSVTEVGELDHPPVLDPCDDREWGVERVNEIGHQPFTPSIPTKLPCNTASRCSNRTSGFNARRTCSQRDPLERI